MCKYKSFRWVQEGDDYPKHSLGCMSWREWTMKSYECGSVKERCLMISNGFRWVKGYDGYYLLYIHTVNSPLW